MKNKKEITQIALNDLDKLFKEAKKNPQMANRYVQMARKIAMKLNLSFPKHLKRKFCKHCYNYFQKGNYRVRTRNKMVVYTCHNCKKYMRFKIQS